MFASFRIVDIIVVADVVGAVANIAAAAALLANSMLWLVGDG